ncbi:hypothetical protein BJV82DRAFT_581901 [Fennellomyces sp. T-0311]|nr:hypothetical protein BJV82DRAFT_581901 [Fennellomyces sp. T-0311]
MNNYGQQRQRQDDHRCQHYDDRNSRSGRTEHRENTFYDQEHSRSYPQQRSATPTSGFHADAHHRPQQRRTRTVDDAELDAEQPPRRRRSSASSSHSEHAQSFGTSPGAPSKLVDKLSMIYQQLLNGGNNIPTNNDQNNFLASTIMMLGAAAAAANNQQQQNDQQSPPTLSPPTTSLSTPLNSNTRNSNDYYYRSAFTPSTSLATGLYRKRAALSSSAGNKDPLADIPSPESTKSSRSRLETGRYDPEVRSSTTVATPPDSSLPNTQTTFTRFQLAPLNENNNTSQPPLSPP